MPSAMDLIGTWRACTPEETMARIRPLFKVTGLTRIARVTGLDHIGIPVSIAVRPMARALSVSQGKGVSDLLADVSAAMESLEFWHAEHPEPPFIEGTYEELSKTHTLLDPLALPKGTFPRVVALQRQACGWVKGRDLATGAEVLVPEYACQMTSDRLRVEPLAVLCSTNGLASGNTFEEAVCHAIFEVIERDAIARWEGRPHDVKTEIDPDSIDGPCADLITRFRRASIRVQVWDATSELGIPTYRATVSGDGELRGLMTSLGQGTHLSDDIALSRALTEAAQSRMTLIAGTRDDTPPSLYAEMRRTADKGPNVSPEKGRPFQRRQLPIPASFEAAIEMVVGMLNEHGFSQTLVVDLTKPALQLPVVYVIIPGMLHSHH